MTLLLGIIFLGIVGGVFINSLMEGRGALGLPVSGLIGAVGGFICGLFGVAFGRFLVGEGPDFILSLFASVVGAVVAVILVSVVKNRLR